MTNATDAQRCTDRRQYADLVSDAQELLEAVETDHPKIDRALAKVCAAQEDVADPLEKLKSACCALAAAIGFESRQDGYRANEAAQLLVIALEVRQR